MHTITYKKYIYAYKIIFLDVTLQWCNKKNKEKEKC
jgi:predicted kinase